MTWPEPLRAEARNINQQRYIVLLITGEGQHVGNVLCTIDRRTRCGTMHELTLTDDGGAPRQRLRGLVLMVREAFRHAADAGITRGSTDAPEQMREFAARMLGFEGRPRGDRTRFSGDVATMRSHILGVTDGDGNFSR